MIAALYVEHGGIYYGLPNVEPWGLPERDARQYAGPWPVVAHPPCDRWCQMAPVNQARYGHKVGDDGGCFEAALQAVYAFGGVLEHPALSLAWNEFGLTRPAPGQGWVRGTRDEGWVCQVAQRNYGHRARKWTWLYYRGDVPPRPLAWGEGPPPEAWISADRPRAELAARGIGQLGKREAKATPLAFRDLLIDLARNSGPRGLYEATDSARMTEPTEPR